MPNKTSDNENTEASNHIHIITLMSWLQENDINHNLNMIIHTDRVPETPNEVQLIISSDEDMDIIKNAVEDLNLNIMAEKEDRGKKEIQIRADYFLDDVVEIFMNEKDRLTRGSIDMIDFNDQE